MIKELVENAFDSGATSVGTSSQLCDLSGQLTADVRIKDHGLDSVEVVDNGSGIEQADWSSIGELHNDITS